MTSDKIDNIVNEVLLEDMPYSSDIKKRGLDKLIDIKEFDDIITVLPDYNSIELLPNFEELKINPLSLPLYNNLNNYLNNFNTNNSLYILEQQQLQVEEEVEKEVGSNEWKSDDSEDSEISAIKYRDVQLKNIYLFNNESCLGRRPEISGSDKNINDLLKNNTLLFLFEDNFNNNRIICESDFETWETVIPFWDDIKYPYRK